MGQSLKHAIALGDIYVTGQTTSSNFIGTNGGFGGGTCSGYPCEDAFIVRISPQGSMILNPKQSRIPEDCLDCKLHWIAANWFTFWPVNTRTGSFYTSM